MKLELKHISPYLPYDLSVKPIEKVFKDEIMIMKGDYIGYFLEGNSLQFKPILRPLSDLSKYVSNSALDKLIGFDIDTTELNYYHLQYLLQNHFDVFGLIEKGLAIDINTLK